jgi:adenosine/AMP kinase
VGRRGGIEKKRRRPSGGKSPEDQKAILYHVPPSVLFDIALREGHGKKLLLCNGYAEEQGSVVMSP